MAVSQIQTAINRVHECFQIVVAQRLYRRFSQRTRKKSKGKDPTAPLRYIMEKLGYVPEQHSLGEAGLRGKNVAIYQWLKNGALPNSVLGKLAVMMYKR